MGAGKSMNPGGQLQNRCALITGASRGLGRAIAEAFWREGASLLLAARRTVALEQVVRALPPQTGQRAIIITADLAEDTAPLKIMEIARKNFDRIHILVNNAAIQEPIGPLCDCDWPAWQRALRVNLLAPVALCRAALLWLVESGPHGKIINLSGGGATGSRPNFSAYATAKAGLVRFSETLANESQSRGVDINCIAPGAMGTDMMKAVLAAGPERTGEREYAQAQKILAAGDTAGMRAVKLAVFLASSASDGITGRLISAVWDVWEQLPARWPEIQKSDIFTLRRITPKDRGFHGLEKDEP